MSFMKSGHCDKGADCKLHHVNDIGSLDVAKRPATAASKSAAPKKLVEEEKKIPKEKETVRHYDGYLTGSKRTEASIMHKRKLEEKEMAEKKS